MNTLDNFAVVLGPDVGNSSADCLFKGITVLEAGLQVGLVVVSGESINKSSKEVSDLNSVKGEVSTVYRGIESTLDWSDKDGGDVSKLLSRIEVLSSIPVVLKGGEVSLDGGLVGGVVEANFGGELSWILEDGSPLLEGSEVVTHILAGVEGLWDLEGSEGELKSSLDVVVDASLLDVGDAELDLLSHELASLVASLDLGEFVVSSHTEDEASDKVGDGHGSNINVSEHLGVGWLRKRFLFNSNNLWRALFYNQR